MILTGTVVVRGPQQTTVVLRAGETLPEWAKGQVGAHLLAEPEPEGDEDGGDEGGTKRTRRRARE